MGVNPDYLNKITLPGQGVRLWKEPHRELFWVALNQVIGQDYATTKYYEWTGYLPRREWAGYVEDDGKKVKAVAPTVDQLELEAFVAFVYAINKCDIEIQDLKAQLQEATDDKEYDFVTGE